MEDVISTSMIKFVASLTFYSKVMPYYGKYLDWELLMQKLCKQTNNEWYKNQSAFHDQYMSTKWWDNDIEIDALIKSYLNITDDNSEYRPYLFKHRFLLTIDDDANSFFNKIADLKASNCIIVCIDHLDKIANREDQTYFIKFLTNTLCCQIPDFKLRFNQFIEIDEYLDALSICLPKVENYIYINQFVFHSKSLKSIIESSKNCTHLAIYDSKIEEINEFTLDTSLEYNIKCLNLSMTICDADMPDRLSINNLSKFIEELAKTNLKSTVKILYLWESYCSDMNKVQDMFNQSGFQLECQEEP